ncbi:hypothetical protein SAMN02745216_03386 [Desulfatibacillum alkenivorans DSM 16219]|uniref:Uncharacterized protein n=1 Tax=Desulfatibacillum alkenivorans DSM 16219 TaxID=1121393 RepID=A0A1M6S463_9BACT|nr:hypothetical protein [Desulfatibacillum alkenivorans]SHK39505.1 hypothetical protein SAMN02745216_03386 [Desulfatibacillum alkenivorans DSM 16219]
MRSMRFYAALAVLLLLAAGCGPKRVSSVRYGSPSAGSKVLLATEDTEFKNTILKNVVKSYEGQDVFIQVESVPALDKINAEDFDAVVLINTCMAWRVEPEIEAFIKKTADKQKIVLLTTTGDPDLNIEAPGVDSVTSASRMENADHVSQKIIGKINRILGAGQGGAKGFAAP